jgi:hypothetical protein
MGNRRKETGDRRKGDAIPVPILLFRILIFQESGERRDGKQETGGRWLNVCLARYPD